MRTSHSNLSRTSLRNRIVVLLSIVSLVSVVTVEARAASIQLFTNEADWLAATSARPTEDFVFDAAGVNLADEVTAPPVNGQNLGDVLTFQATNTALSFDFDFTNEAPDPDGGIDTFIIFLTTPPAPRLGVSPTFNHDWGVGFGAGNAVFGAGMTLFGSPLTTFEVYDTGGTLLASLAPLPPAADFFGVISDVPIGQIVQDSDPVSGGQGLIEMNVLVPEPGTALLLGLGLVAIAARRRASL